jgi:predicted amidophosphoribosyltransferase
MPRVQDVFNAHRALYGPVPAVGNDYVCEQCLGPVSGFAQCYACHQVFGWAPAALERHVVPMTSALSPSPWYTRLLTYKQGHPEYGAALAALTHVYLEANSDRIEQLVGGALTVLTIVPSKRGLSFDDQPFRKTLARVPPIRDRLVQTLIHVAGQTVGRREYNPAAFACGPVRVRGERIVLLDDTWVTGATAVSAAGALLREGAKGVVLLPLARMVDSEFWPKEHPYRQAMSAVPYDPAVWPR